MFERRLLIVIFSALALIGVAAAAAFAVVRSSKAPRYAIVGSGSGIVARLNVQSGEIVTCAFSQCTRSLQPGDWNAFASSNSVQTGPAIQYRAPEDQETQPATTNVYETPAADQPDAGDTPMAKDLNRSGTEKRKK
jgi:hypothetical protein